MTRRVLCVRLDSLGDVLVTGPAVRAVAAGADHVAMLVGPLGAEAARLLPGVDEVHVWPCPWVLAEPPPTTRGDVEAAVDLVASTAADDALVFTSFHQSPLPAALVLRMAGVPHVGAISVDYPGSLLDVRHRVDEDLPEPERALSLATACGYPTPDDGRLAVRRPLPDVRHLTGSTPYVVLHPGASVPARRWPGERFAATTRRLASRGVRVVVTGSPEERELTALVAGADGLDLGGRTSLAETAAVIAGARAVVVGNTGPAHLAAAVGTPVVSLFAPTVPADRWAPYGVPRVLLGDQHAACRGSRARTCPVPGHPCLSSVNPEDVVVALGRLLEVAA
ncbi:MAG TPA: glycosyltransferase family 9 protein [Jiangellales bacterium]|nr:glycosyltransferase family 9 protein [Jiangellales bacterium]